MIDMIYFGNSHLMFWLQKRNWRMAVHKAWRRKYGNGATIVAHGAHARYYPSPRFLDVRDLMPVMEMADRSLQQMRFDTETFCQTFTSCVGISGRQCNAMQVFFCVTVQPNLVFAKAF